MGPITITFILLEPGMAIDCSQIPAIFQISTQIISLLLQYKERAVSLKKIKREASRVCLLFNSMNPFFCEKDWYKRSTERKKQEL
jgi:hypothetical protein